MSKLLDILEPHFSGDFDDNPAALADIEAFEKRTGRRIPPDLRELLQELNGFSFHTPPVFRGKEVLGFLSLRGMEDVHESIGHQIPQFLLPFASYLEGLFGTQSDDYVYSVDGVGYPTPHITIIPADLTIGMFLEEMVRNQTGEQTDASKC